MGKRYYCDFCDKSFADNPTSRKNHLKGVQHQRNRKNHYDSFRDPEIILSEEQTKKPCKIFLSSGYCNFFENCKFSHLTTEDRQRLEKQVQERREARAKQEGQSDDDTDIADTSKYVKQWLSKINKDVAVKDKKEDFPEETPIQYTVPPHLLQLPSIPPSLLPPPPGAFDNLLLEEWG